MSILWPTCLFLFVCIIGVILIHKRMREQAEIDAIVEQKKKDIRDMESSQYFRQAQERMDAQNAQMENLRQAANQWRSQMGMPPPLGGSFGQQYGQSGQHSRRHSQFISPEEIKAAAALGMSYEEYFRAKLADESMSGPWYSYGHNQQPEIDPKLQEAFNVLGIPYSSSKDEIKKTYRKLMNKHHPDKRAARGLPEGDSKEMTQKILAAYELIKESKGFK